MSFEQKDKMSVTRLDLVSVDQHVSFVSQKSEKITLALYAVSEFIKDEEPFKWKIRDKSMQFLSLANSLQNFPISAEKETVIANGISLLSEILSLLRFGASARFVSQMNYSILRDEYVGIFETLKDRISKRQQIDNVVLPQSLLEIDLDEVNSSPLSIRQNLSYKNNLKVKDEPATHRDEKRQVLETGKNSNSRSTIESSFQSKDFGNEDPATAKNSFSHGAYIMSDRKKKDRRDTIIQSLSLRGTMSIKDIAEMLPDCGEKTIQRELFSLIQEGVIKREGERRWSRYSLIK